jgi:dihydrofolate reductase
MRARTTASVTAGTASTSGGWRTPTRDPVVRRGSTARSTTSDNHNGVPIFILYRQPPGIDIEQWPLVTPVSDVTSAMRQAKEAAGDENVLVHGVGVARLALAAGVLDELELHVVPVLFGQGRRLFEGLAAEQIELERTRILHGESGVTHMHYRVLR